MKRQIRPEDVRDVLPLCMDSDRNQIVERLGWTPRQRLDYLLDMLAFEERARRVSGG